MRVRDRVASSARTRLFTRTAIKEGMPEVSKVRLEQTLYAEYPSLRFYCEKLRSEKSAQTPDSLASIWDVDRAEVLGVARKLVVGFFEERVVKDLLTFWVPFLYRLLQRGTPQRRERTSAYTEHRSPF